VTSQTRTEKKNTSPKSTSTSTSRGDMNSTNIYGLKDYKYASTEDTYDTTQDKEGKLDSTYVNSQLMKSTVKCEPKINEQQLKKITAYLMQTNNHSQKHKYKENRNYGKHNYPSNNYAVHK
jgi:hypothetical protein